MQMKPSQRTEDWSSIAVSTPTITDSSSSFFCASNGCSGVAETNTAHRKLNNNVLRITGHSQVLLFETLLMFYIIISPIFG